MSFTAPLHRGDFFDSVSARVPSVIGAVIKRRFLPQRGRPGSVRRPARSSRDLAGASMTTARSASGRYEELIWTAYMGNDGSAGEVWYDSRKHEFVFYHSVW